MNCPLKKGFACFTRRDPVMKSARSVSTNETKTFRTVATILSPSLLGKYGSRVDYFTLNLVPYYINLVAYVYLWTRMVIEICSCGGGAEMAIGRVWWGARVVITTRSSDVAVVVPLVATPTVEGQRGMLALGREWRESRGSTSTKVELLRTHITKSISVKDFMFPKGGIKGNQEKGQPRSEWWLLGTLHAFHRDAVGKKTQSPNCCSPSWWGGVTESDGAGHQKTSTPTKICHETYVHKEYYAIHNDIMKHELMTLWVGRQ